LRFRSKEERKRKAQERINTINSMPNFLSVVEMKEEDRNYLESLLSPANEEKYDIKEDGNVFIYKQGQIIDITTIGQLCEKKAKEIRDGVV